MTGSALNPKLKLFEKKVTPFLEPLCPSKFRFSADPVILDLKLLLAQYRARAS